MSSYIAKPSEIERKWYVLDAEGKTLGHLASEAASILRGKKKPTYTPYIDCGDYVIVINAEKRSKLPVRRQRKRSTSITPVIPADSVRSPSKSCRQRIRKRSSATQSRA